MRSVISVGDIPSGARVVLYSRVSGSRQKQTLALQTYEAREQLKLRGCKVVASIDEATSGRRLNRRGLLRSLNLAQQKNAYLVAHDITRLIRNRNKRQNTRLIEETTSQASVQELCKLAECYGVVLAVVEQTISERQLRPLQIKRGLKLSPNRKQGRLRWACLRRGGLSLREIGDWFNVAPTTVGNFLKKLGQQSGCIVEKASTSVQQAYWLHRGGWSLEQIARHLLCSIQHISDKIAKHTQANTAAIAKLAICLFQQELTSAKEAATKVAVSTSSLFSKYYPPSPRLNRPDRHLLPITHPLE